VSALRQPESRQHSSYERRPLDLPWRGRVVRLRVNSRRWFCDEPTCRREIFAERFTGALAAHARRTDCATQLLLTIALQSGGEAGARLAQRVGLPTSPDTLLRLLHSMEDVPQPTPRVLGVDDVALRRGRRRYGTLLVNLETHRPIDLLDERTAEVLAAWLRDHPGVEVIVRDRADAYAEGARQGAPGAIQVADRFHLVANASGALDEVLRSRKRHVEYVVVDEPEPPPTVVPVVPPRPPSRAKQRELEARTRRTARWQVVRERHAAGESIRRIALDLAMSRGTVRRLLKTPDPPRNRPPERPRPGGLTSPSLLPFRGYLEARWQDGCSNIAQLKRELDAQGYCGSYSLLMQALLPWRGSRPPPDPVTGRRPRRRAAPRTKRFNVRWLCLRPPQQLDEHEREALRHTLAADERVARGYDLLQRFRRLVARHSVRELDGWLEDSAASGLPPFVSLVRGIRTDRDAVNAGLTLPWSTGPVEGHVTRVKLIKRSGYGRQSTPLLRRRVVSAA
jgi:transposase